MAKKVKMLRNRWLQVSAHSARENVYLEQLSLVGKDDNVLEIGKGKGIAAKLLTLKARSVDTFDLDPETRPSFVGNCARAADINFLTDRYSIIFCCQVLEHMDQVESFTALENLIKLNPKRLILSLPDNRKSHRLGITIGARKFSIVITRPRSGRKISQQNSRQHHWEIYSKNIKSLIRHFDSYHSHFLTRHYRLFERPYSHFFIFERR